MKRTLALLLFALAAIATGPLSTPSTTAAPLVAVQAQDRYESLLAKAEAEFEKQSYTLALRHLETAAKLELTAPQRAWIDWRLADTRWRALAASSDPDPSELDAAKKALDDLLATYERPEDRDDRWALIQESIADFHWLRRNARNHSAAFAAYSLALEYWAGSAKLEIARERYLDMVWRMISPTDANEWEIRNNANSIAQNILFGAEKLASTPEERARVQYYIALRGERHVPSDRVHQRTQKAFEAVLAEGQATTVYADALYAYGVWLEERGAQNLDAQRGFWTSPDYVAALVLYRRLLEEYSRGTHEHWNDARHRIQKITSEEVSLGVSQVFLPNSEVQFQLRWRNLDNVQLSLHPVELTRAVDFEGKDVNNDQYLASIDLAQFPALHTWRYATGDQGLHHRGDARIRPEAELLPGAYVIQAKGGTASSRELILISDSALVVKSEEGRLVAWYADVFTGQPIAGAELSLWEREERRTPWVRHDLRTDADGLCVFDLPTSSGRRHQYFLSARFEKRQAFSLAWEQRRYRRGAEWKIYAVADRGAYRPGQDVSWKFTARVREDNRYRTPGEAKVRWELWGPTGEVHANAVVTLNDFGSAKGVIVPEASWPLGEYQIRFFEPGKGSDERGTYYGAGTLFRLEEYKRPEFLVQVERTTDEDGKPQRYLPGDLAEMRVSASYYFGGAVTNATAEVRVYRKAYYKSFPEKHEFPWYHSKPYSYRGGWNRGPGELVQTETLSIGPEGQLDVRFETVSGDRQDYEYTVEARVTDSSRREVTGTGRLRVTHQSWFAKLDTPRRLNRPGLTASIELQASDADDAPVEAQGSASLMRLVWKEVWHNPEGHRVEGDELRMIRALGGPFPPNAKNSTNVWRPIRIGYEEELVETTTLTTDSQGRAKWDVKLPTAGHYVVRFAAEDDHGAAITAEVALECLDETTVTSGLHQESARLIFDADTFREDEPGLVMISSPASNRWMLFSVESESLIEYRVVHLSGNVKLLRLDVDESWVPNAQLSLASFDSGRYSLDVQQVVVPPRKHFLDVDLSLEPGESLPGGKGVAEIRVTDHAGQPVAAEVALSIVDASIDAIQPPYAIDPRQFFYGDLRPHTVSTSASMDTRAYVRLVEKDGELLHARFAWEEKLGRQGGAGGGPLADNELAALAELGYAGSAPGSSGPSTRAGMRSRGKLRDEISSDSADFFLGLGQASPSMAKGGADLGEAQGDVAVQVRSDFRETALWLPDLVTDEEGRARTEFKYPDSLTNWKAVARTNSRATDVGITEGESATRLPLLVRLQLPRFLVEGDECLVSLNVDNRTDQAIDARTELSIEGLEVLGFVGEEGLQADAPGSVRVPASDGVRLDWRVRAVHSGSARFVAKVRSADYGDGVEREIAIEPHGILSHEIRAGRIDGDGVDVTLDLPVARREGSTQLEVQVTPSLAVTMLDALPYLVDYPYGCTEQTLSRFVPTVVVARTLEDLGLDPALAMDRVYGGIEREFADKTQRDTNAGLEDLQRATELGLQRLYDFQHADGSWSWWKHGDGDRFMTAYVVWGLTLAREAGVEVDTGKLDAGALWLARELITAKKDPALQAWMLHATSAWLGHRQGDARGFANAACDNLLERRVSLNAYGRALLCLSAHQLGRAQDAQLLARNLIDGVLRDDAPDASIIPVGTLAGGTQAPRAHWGEDGAVRRWADGGVEATAFALKALVAVDPTHELIEPAAEWLVANRRGAQWSNTKTTSIVVLALNDYLQRSGQLARSVSYSVSVNGTRVGLREITPETILAATATFDVEEALIRNGKNRVEIRRVSGEGPLYFTAHATFFSREEPIPPRGNEVFVRRQYFKLVPRPTLLRGTRYDRVLMQDGDSIKSGERVEVVLTVETKNHLEYLLFEDLKPAGLEAAELKSGEPVSARELRSDEVQHRLNPDRESRTGRGQRRHGETFEVGYTGRTRSMHQELRDRKVAFFLDQCPEGVWEIRYDLRAEAPGDFHALPLMAEAMYVPEIRANGAELRLEVLDRDDM